MQKRNQPSAIVNEHPYITTTLDHPNLHATPEERAQFHTDQIKYHRGRVKECETAANTSKSRSESGISGHRRIAAIATGAMAKAEGKRHERFIKHHDGTEPLVRFLYSSHSASQLQ
jgi:hypothetical protein